MSREGLQLTAVEHYRMLVNWVTVLPTFRSLEAALSILRPEQGHQISFCVYRAGGTFDIHRAWWSKDELTSQRDFSIMIIELNKWRERAIMELGAAQLEQMNLDHLNTVCNGNTRFVESALIDTTANSSTITEEKVGSSSP